MSSPTPSPAQIADELRRLPTAASGGELEAMAADLVGQALDAGHLRRTNLNAHVAGQGFREAAKRQTHSGRRMMRLAVWRRLLTALGKTEVAAALADRNPVRSLDPNMPAVCAAVADYLDPAEPEADKPAAESKPNTRAAGAR